MRRKTDTIGPMEQHAHAPADRSPQRGGASSALKLPDTVRVSSTNLQVQPALGDADFPAYAYFARRDARHPRPIPLHWHHELEVLTVLEGMLEISCPGASITANAGDVVLINQRTPHLYRNPDGNTCESHIGCCFMPELIAEKASRVYRRCVQPALEHEGFRIACFSGTQAAGRNAHEALRGLYGIPDTSDQMYELILRDLLSQAWRSLAPALLAEEGSFAARASASAERLELMLLYIAENYQHRISLDDLAACASICRSEVVRSFKSHLGMTAGEYLLQQRIAHACELLQTGEPVSRAAENCGFASPSYFARRFKELTGTTPRTYRDRMRAEEEDPTLRRKAQERRSALCQKY